MKTTVKRRRKLPAFQIEVADLEQLVSKMSPLFGSEKIYLRIDIECNKKEFSFSEIDEMYKIKELPDRVLSFDFSMTDFKRSVHLFPGLATGYPARITTEAEDEVWCAGAVETMLPTFYQAKSWYSWFRGWPIGAGLLLSLQAITSKPLINKLLGNAAGYSTLIATVPLIVFALLYVSRYWLLPTNVLIIRRADSNLENRSRILTLGIAFLSLVVAIVGLFIRK